MDWNTFFTSLFASMGGALGIALIILRSAKKRMETYIDDAIQYKFDIKIEEYKQNLNKQFSNYETFSKRYYDCIEKVVKQLNEAEKYLKVMQEGINRCLNESLTFDYIFKQNDDLHSLTNLGKVSEELRQTWVTYHICLSDHMIDMLEDVINLINEYTAGIKREMTELHINRVSCQGLLDSGKNISNKIYSLSKNIREEWLHQSGEL